VARGRTRNWADQERATLESAMDEEHAYLRSRFARSSRRRQLRRGIRRQVTEDGGGMHPDTCSARPGALFDLKVTHRFTSCEGAP
jgi:hypothetical protein